uniref:Uncharacterized protein n=1 Tax=Alexandrium catenella TaxID=2925 RepID=A0A7S1QE94_ALECA
MGCANGKSAPPSSGGQPSGARQDGAAQSKTLLARSGSGGKSPCQKDTALDADAATAGSPVPAEEPAEAAPPETVVPVAAPAADVAGAADIQCREEAVVSSAAIATDDLVRPLSERDGLHNPASAVGRRRKRKGTPWPGKGGNPLEPLPPDEADARWWLLALPQCCTACHEVEEDLDD